MDPSGLNVTGRKVLVGPVLVPGTELSIRVISFAPRLVSRKLTSLATKQKENCCLQNSQERKATQRTVMGDTD